MLAGELVTIERRSHRPAWESTTPGRFRRPAPSRYTLGMTDSATTLAATERDLDAIRGRYEQAREGLLRRRLSDMTVEQLERIDAHLGERVAEAVDDLEELHGRAEERLGKGDLPAFRSARSRAVDLTGQYDELREMRQEVHDARQARLLHDRLVASLGSPRRLFALDTFIMTLIVLVIGVLIAHVTVPMSGTTSMWLDWVDVGACCIFLADFFYRHHHAESKRWFWRRYWLDFVTSIPIPSAQALRIGRSVRLLRLARMIRVVQLMRVLRIVLFFWRGMDKLAAAFDVKMMRRSLKILAIVLVLGGLGIWWAEGASGHEGVENVGQSLWWSFTTVVTGGYGDIHNPQSMTGRLLTVALVIAGMVVVGVFTATLTSLLVRENDATSAVLEMQEQMEERLEGLKRELAPAKAEGPPDGGQ